MTDRGKIAALLLMLGAGLAIVGAFQGMYSSLYPGLGGPDKVYTTSLWITTLEPGNASSDPYYVFGWPVTIAAVVAVVAAVLLVRERTSFIGRPVAMGAAGALAGTVFAYVLQVRHEKVQMESWPFPDTQRPRLNILPGIYLLVAAAIIGLAGAVLAQRKQQPADPEEEEDVVVHHLDSDDDTPPFGIAIAEQEREQEQEAR